MREVTLQDRDGLHVAVSLRADDGALVIRGDVHRQSPWGAEDYEYSMVIAPDDVPRVLHALGAPDAGVDPLDVMLAHKRDVMLAGERAWLRSIGIEPEFHTTEG